MPWPVHPNGLLGAQGSDNDAYQISRSLRFNSADSAYLNRTFGTPTDNRKWSISFWMKRGALDGRIILGSAVSSSLIVFFDTSNRIDVRIAGTQYFLTTPVYRDTSAWYHFQLVFDSANATQDNRIILYINGIRQTASVQSCPPNQNTGFNSASAQSNLGLISGWFADSRDYFDGYLTEINFIDGQALTPSSFGETDAVTGRWKAKAYSGTYGTNGFYLKFADNSSTAALGTDSSGNGNTWTTNNFSVTAGVGNDSLLDSPTNSGTSGNYCTLNPLNKAPNRITLLNGNLDLSQDSSGNGNWNNCIATNGVTTGKWYWEITPTSAGEHLYGVIGSEPTTSNIIADNTSFTWLKYTTNSCGYYSGGVILNDNQTTVSTSVSSFTSGDVIGIALDAGSKTIQFYKNNSSQYTHTFSGNANWLPAFAVARNSATCTFTVNFGQRPFAYTAPSGFKALCTTNLTTPTIKKPSSYMDVVTYTGTGASNSISSLGFSPDLVWIKNRGGATSHAIYDAVRGVQAQLSSDTTGSEVTSSTGLTAFDASGFTIGTSSLVNTNGTQYVAWSWDAGSTNSTNNSGSITSTVRANPQAGFSIVSYTGNGNTSSGETIGHGLGATPAMFITKMRNATGTDYGWSTWHKSLSSTNGIWLDKTNGQNSSMISANPVTSTTFKPFDKDYNNVLNATYINYVFAEIEGYSKFGSYTGNGSSDGPFCWTGFRPRWILYKRTDASGTNWAIYDTARDSFNVSNNLLLANTSDSEQTSYTAGNIDILSNGFKVRATWTGANASGGTYIFAAFAEAPFKYARAR